MIRTARPPLTAVRVVGAITTIVGFAFVLLGMPPSTAATSGPSVVKLAGTFHLDRVSCRDGKPSGSWLSVTFGTRIVANQDSSCDHGAFTLLPSGTSPLSTGGFTPAGAVGFGPGGTPLAGGLTSPVEFNGHDVDLVTSADDLQDAPEGPAAFAPPTVYLVGDRLSADLRSIQALYDGPSGNSCRQSAGQGCWLIGAERATGTYNPRTHRFSLEWFSGQSFSSASAGLEVHLAGTFQGFPKAVPSGTQVELGTQSYVAGTPDQARDAALVRESGHAVSSGTDGRRSKSKGRHDGGSSAGRRRGGRGPSLRTMSEARKAGSVSSSPTTFLIGELAVAVNIFAMFVAAVRRKSR